MFASNFLKFVRERTWIIFKFIKSVIYKNYGMFLKMLIAKCQNKFTNDKLCNKSIRQLHATLLTCLSFKTYKLKCENVSYQEHTIAGIIYHEYLHVGETLYICCSERKGFLFMTTYGLLNIN